MQEQSSQLSWQTAAIVNINAMVGAGIFSLPLALLGSAGPAGMITFAFVLIAVWMLAQSLATVAARMPANGSLYAYAASWGGPRAGAIALGAYLSGLMIAMGLLVQIVGPYIAQLITTATHASPLSSSAWGIIALCVLIAITIGGHNLPTWGQRMLFVATVSPLVIISALCLKHAHLAYLTPFAPAGAWKLFTAVKTVIFGFFGFECATSLAAHIKDPHRNVPKAVTLSVLVVGVLYACFIGSIMLAVPRDALIAAPTITDALIGQFPHHVWLLEAVSCAIVSAILGTLHSMLWSTSMLFASTAPLLLSGWKPSMRLSTMIIGGGVLVARLILHNQELFFSLTSLGIVTAYVMALGNLFWTKPVASRREKLLATGGMIAALIIAICALEGIIKSIL